MIKIRKVFLDDLPKNNLFGKDRIDWKECVGLEVKFIYDDIEGNIYILSYNEENKITIKYRDKEFEIHTISFKNCNLGRVLGKITNEFKIKVEQIFKDNKRDITIIDRKYRDKINKYGRIEKQKWYKYKCNKCGYNEGWISEGSLLKGSGCSCCCNPPKIVVEGINDIPTTDPWMVKYFQGGYEEAKMYTYCSSSKIKPICPECGRIKHNFMKIENIYKYKSISCNCSDGKSYPEKFMFNVLEQLKVNFICEKTFKWCKYTYKEKIKKGRYDFYFELENNKYIVEMDGLFHDTDNFMSGITAEESKYIDYEKDRLAEENGISVIRIDSRKSDSKYIINNIINSEISVLFDLINIDWTKASEFALSNIVKEVCEFKRKNKEKTSMDISKKFNLANGTVIGYLNKGAELGWCDYNPKEEQKKAVKKIGEKYLGSCKKPKPIEILKNGVSLGIFNSISELSRQSEELFGTKLGISSMSNVCVGKLEEYKGFTFNYA